MRQIRFLLLAALLLAVPFTTSAQTSDQSWPRWRGARFDGTVTTGRNVFGAPFELRVRWRKTLGPGYSAIAIAEGHAVTMFSDGTTDFLIALASDTGEERWRVPLAPTFPPRDGSTGGPVSTPAIDAGVAYGLGPRGELVAVELATGKVLWQRQLVKELGAVEPHWGFTTSPLVSGELVIVLTGISPGKAVTAFNRKTGAIVWQTGSDAASYQSPMLASIDGRTRVLVGGDKWLMALDPADGREIWKHEHGGTGFFGMIINPVAVGRDAWLLTHKPGESVLVGGAAAPAAVWTTRDLRGSYSSPVVHGDTIFGMAGGFLSAVSAETGERRWRSRPPGDGFQILVDGHLVVITKQGQLAVVEATGEAYREKASMALFDRLVWTPPSFADGRIFARDSYDGIAAVAGVPARDTTRPSAAAAAAPVLPDSAFAARVAEIEASADPQAALTAYLASKPAMPIIEAGRYAHIVFTGDVTDLELLIDGRDADGPVPLTRIRGTEAAYASFAFEPDARVSYQFVRGGTEVVADPRNTLTSASLNRADASAVLLMPEAAPIEARPAGALRGRVVDLELEIPIVRAEHLQWGGKRPAHVYLPPGYDASPDVRYPTAYVMYGDVLREAHLDALIDRAMGETLAPMIVVFLPSTSGFEYARTFRDEHTRMMVDVMVPWIDGQFRTRRGAADRALVGVDEAGFWVVEAALQHPGVFGTAISQSIFSMTGAADELLALIGRTEPAGQRFHVDWGRYDYRRASDLTDIAGYSTKVRDALVARGYRVGGREWNDGMALSMTASRMLAALRELFPASAAR